MSLSIHRDDIFTLNQPSIDENIENANRLLVDYVDEHKNDFKGGDFMSGKIEVNTDLKNIDVSEFDDIIVLILTVIINDTELDDRLMKILSDMVKNSVPGDKFEPLLGKLLVELGEQLQEK